MARLKVLAIAVATGRVGYVYLIGNKLRDWGMSRKASRSTAEAAAQAQTWINELKPDVVVTEKLHRHSRKGSKTRDLIAAIARVASHNYLLDVAVNRVQNFPCKYTEAKALVDRFPILSAWLPRKRRIWEPEPRSTIYFEALALALAVQRA